MADLYRDLIEGALANLEGEWPADPDGRRLPCGACEHTPVTEALCGEQPVHVYHRGVGAFDALLDRVWAGRVEQYWLGRLHVGSAAHHPSGAIGVWAFNEPPVTVTREADIIPALLDLWGYPESEAA